MAEFQEVVKSYKRMCDSYETCEECPMLTTEIARSVAHCRYTVFMEPEKAEDLITEWAEEHPIVTNRMKFKEVFGCDIVTHEIHEAIPGHVKILNASDEEFEEWLDAEYEGGQDGTDQN